MPKDIKNTIRIIISFFCGMFFALFLVWIYSKLGPYDVRIKSFTENGSYVEYPQIKGLKNKENQFPFKRTNLPWSQGYVLSALCQFF